MYIYINISFKATRCMTVPLLDANPNPNPNPNLTSPYPTTGPRHRRQRGGADGLGAAGPARGGSGGPGGAGPGQGLLDGAAGRMEPKQP